MNIEISHDAQETKKVLRAKEKEKYERDIDLEHWRAVLNTESGRHVLWQILCETQYFGLAPSLSPGDLTVHQGKRTIGRFVTMEIEAVDPEIYLQMIRENRENGK